MDTNLKQTIEDFFTEAERNAIGNTFPLKVVLAIVALLDNYDLMITSLTFIIVTVFRCEYCGLHEHA